MKAVVLHRGGTRPALVFLHGFLGRPESFESLARLLEYDGPVIALTLPGHNPSVPAQPARGFDGAVDDLAAALAALGREPVHLVGYSMGGRLALGLLARYGRRIARAVLIGASPGLADPGERAVRAREDAHRAAMLRKGGLEDFVNEWERMPLFASQRTLSLEDRERQRVQRLSHDPEELARSLEQVGLASMPDYLPALERVGVLVDLVAGEHDEKFREQAARMARVLPRATVHVVPGVGHNVVLEAPGFLARLLSQL